MINAQRKRSITFSSIEPYLFCRARDPHAKEKLRTTSINSLASGILSSGRQRAGTWHGKDEETRVNASENVCDDIADLKDFDSEIESKDELKQIISEELTRALNDCDYESEKCVGQCIAISQAVESKVKRLKGIDTKVVVVVYIGEIRDQGIEVTTQCLWNPEDDSFATSSYRNKTLFSLCTVFTVS